MTVGPGLARARAAARACPALAKIGALTAAGALLFLVGSLAVLTGALAGAWAASLLLLGRRASLSVWTLGLVWPLLAVVGFAAAFEGPAQAFVVFCRVVTLVVLAHLVTATTQASAMQEALVTALRPLERLHLLSAEKAGLALAVTLRSLPRIKAAMGEIRDAHAARGLRPAPSTLLIPLIVRVLRQSEETADAIDARSWSGAARRHSDDHA